MNTVTTRVARILVEVTDEWVNDAEGDPFEEALENLDLPRPGQGEPMWRFKPEFPKATFIEWEQEEEQEPESPARTWARERIARGVVGRDTEGARDHAFAEALSVVARNGAEGAGGA